MSRELRHLLQKSLPWAGKAPVTCTDFFLSFDNTNDRLSQERLLRSRNFATMVT